MNIIKKILISYDKKPLQEGIADINFVIIMTFALSFLEYDLVRTITNPNIISLDKIPLLLISNLLFVITLLFLTAVFEELKKSKNKTDE